MDRPRSWLSITLSRGLPSPFIFLAVTAGQDPGRTKGQRHKVFEDSFDANECYSKKFVYQKLEYMHKNPVIKKWQLVNDFTDYLHSSAAFYEKGIHQYKKLLHVNEVLL